MTIVLATALLCLTLPWVARSDDAPTSAGPDAATVAAPEAAPVTEAPLETTPAPTASSGRPASFGGFAAPDNLLDLPAWLAYKSRNHMAALPQEARLFYRRGLMTHQSGNREEALRLVRGAAELDPAYVAPHLTLASWLLLSEPSQALLQYASILDLARQNFMFQLALAGNALYLGMQALFLALLFSAILLVALHQRELRHGWKERLSRWISPQTARWWSWAFVILPYLAGFGPVLPTVVLLGTLWPSLRVRERALFISFVAVLCSAPWAAGQLERLTLPLRDDLPPMHGVALVEHEPWSEQRQRSLAEQAAARPEDPFAQFASGWMARRGLDLPAAEAAYRRALARWPNDDRVENNLGNTLALQGRADEALALYLEATRHNPANAAAWFNASQIYTQRYDYDPATRAITRASALDFELVKTFQAQATQDGVLPLADQWIAPRAFWAALRTAPASRSHGALPPGWRSRNECSGWVFSVTALLLAVLGVAAGIAQHRSIPLRRCSNCGAIVCRRCARRRRETALCVTCETVEGRAESADFAQALMLDHRRHTLSRGRLLRTALATLIPGYGLLSFRRLFTPVLLLSIVSALVSGALHLGPPFSYEPRVALTDPEIPVPVLLGLWVFVYAVSILGYFYHVNRAALREAALVAPTRSRTTQSSRQTPAAAA